MNEFSTTIAEEIFASYPEWRTRAREEDAQDGSTYLYIEVPTPAAANTTHGLEINTDNEEVTVTFDFYHSHFERWKVQESGFEHEASPPFVQALLSESVAVASWWQGEQWRGSCQLAVGEEPELTVAEEFNRIRVRSWQGNRNDDRDA
jgi:hypothetical protein